MRNFSALLKVEIADFSSKLTEIAIFPVDCLFDGETAPNFLRAETSRPKTPQPGAETMRKVPLLTACGELGAPFPGLAWN